MGKGNPRNQMIPPLLLKHKMHMRRPPRMSLQQLQQLSNRPIVGNRVRYRHNCLEPKHALLVAIHHTSPIGPLSIAVLDVIMPCTIRLPNVNLHALNWVPAHVFYGAENETRLPFGVVRHQVPVGYGFCFVGVEGAED